MSAPSRISMGEGVRMRNSSSGGVMAWRFPASEKKGKTFSTGRGRSSVAKNRWVPRGRRMGSASWLRRWAARILL